MFRPVGSKMDWTVPYRMNRHTAITGGYSDFFPGPFIQESEAAEGIHFEYIMIHYTFLGLITLSSVLVTYSTSKT